MAFSSIDMRRVKRLLALKPLTAGDAHVSALELQRFGWVFGGMSVSVFGLLLPWLIGQSFALWPWLIAVVVWAQALFIPSSLQLLYALWMLFGTAMGFINTCIIMFLLYGLIFVPVGILMRITGRDALARTFKSNEMKSYRIECSARPRDHFERPY